jgi:L-amino acid N-acyltransferase YncA
MNYHIESIKDEDIASCLEIYNYYIENTTITFEEKSLTLNQFSQRVHSIRERYPYIVLKDEKNTVLGYCYLSEFNERSAYRISADLSIYVSKDHQKEHIGAFLLKEIEELAKKQEIYNLISIITSENDTSMKFHEHHGFIKEGELKDIAFKQNKVLGCSFYRKFLLDTTNLYKKTR